MFEEEIATMNGYPESSGYTGSSVLAPAESAGESALWTVHEDIWANPGELSAPQELTEEHTYEDMDAVQRETLTFQELPYEGGAQEESAFESPSFEDTSFEDSSYETSAFEDTWHEHPSFEDTASEDASAESIHQAGESAYEDTSQEETYEDMSVAGPMSESVGYEQASYEPAGYEQAGDEQAGDEQAGYEQAGYEQTGYEQTGYEQTGYEQTGYEDIGLEDMPSTSFGGTETLGELNPELLNWPGEVFAEDWNAGGEASVQPDPRFGTTEHLQEEGPRGRVPAGERTVSNHPLLRTHHGTQPDLVVRWSSMPRSTRAVDVVVHLHGYSASGPRMKIQDKAAASGADLGSRGGGATMRPMLGLVPRGNYFGGQSGAGYNFPELVQPGAISRLVASGLELLRTQTGVQASLGRLILTGHSGGGAPLNAILRHTDADEVHLFDGSYGDMSHLIAWAARRIARGSATSALRVLFRPGTGTAKNALAIAGAICPTISASSNAAGMHRRFRVEATQVEHNLIPATYGRLLLADAGADLPGAVRQGCRHAGGTGSAPAAAPGGTRTPDRVAGVVKVTPYAKDGSRALPGAVALAQQWRRLTGRRAGTFNVRNTSFGKRSLHSEGRAIDCHGDVSEPDEASQADAYIRWLMANAVELQVSTIIWNRRIWSWPRRAQGWRSYMTKPNHNPHTDHFHVDLSWEGALHPSALFTGGVPGFGAGAGAAPRRAAPGTAGTAPRRPVPTAPSRPSASGPAPQAGAKRSPAEFVRMFGPYAKASEAKTGVPGLVTLGQAAAESGWGARAAGNNFFGIKAKASDAPGTRQLCVTREVLSRPDVRSFPEVISVKARADGRYDYVVRDWFRVFPSPELAFVGHGEFLRRNKRYAGAFAFRNDPYRFMAEVARAGFATDPRYTKLVHSVMRLLERSGWN